jgi:hypothetical protein
VKAVEPLKFSFHDSLALRIESDQPEVRDYYRSEYSHHVGEPPDGIPLVRLEWTSRTEGLQPEQHKVLARWRSRLRFGEDEVAIEASGNRFSIPMVHHMMVHPSLRLLASQRGELLLHAASVARGGRSLILAGAGGAGKTTSSALLLSSGGESWEIHGDDYVFLGAGRRTHAYITRSHLYRSLLAWAPEVGSRLTRGERLRLELWGRVRAWSGDRIKWPVRLSVDRLWPRRGICREAEAAAIVLLRRGETIQPGLAPATRGPSIFERLIEMNFAEARHFIRIAWKGDEAAPEVRRWREREREAVERLSEGVPFYWLDLPPAQRAQPELGPYLVGLLERLLSGAT